MSILNHSPNGCPRPVGTSFRQQYFHEPDDAWVVSVVDATTPDGTITGTVIEARQGRPSGRCVVAFFHEDRPAPTRLPSIIERALNTDDGWRHLTVRPCAVTGCTEPVPMWERNVHNFTECLTCAARTVRACRECGMPDDARYANRGQLLERQLCFRCDLWTDRLTTARTDPQAFVSDDFVFYGIGPGGRSPEHSGFAGRRFTITWHDGSTPTESHDLWYGGPVPAHFRDRFTPTATVTAGKP